MEKAGSMNFLLFPECRKNFRYYFDMIHNNKKPQWAVLVEYTKVHFVAGMGGKTFVKLRREMVLSHVICRYLFAHRGRKL